MERATEALEAMGDAPDKREDYGGWLQHQKAKWKVSRLKRKRRRAEEEEALVRASGAVGGITPGGRGPRPRLLGPGGLGAFVESRERTLARSPWHVIQVEPAPGPPGRFTAWVLAAGAMHAVPLKIARRLSVAMRAPDREGDLGVGGKRRVAAILPRGAKAEHVYEVSMEESDFVSGLEVMDLLANPNVVGVFERHVPLLEAAVQKIGCVATLRHDADAGAGAVTQYDLDALEMRTAAECGYLPLAHAAAKAGRRATCTVCCDTCHCTTRGPRIRVCTRCTPGHERRRARRRRARGGRRPRERRARRRERSDGDGGGSIRQNCRRRRRRRVRVSPERRERRGGRHRGPIGALREGSRLDRGVRQERRGRGRRARRVV